MEENSQEIVKDPQMIKDPQIHMKTTPTLKLLLSMSLPVILSMLIQSLYNIIDSLWVSRLGNDALTAVSLAFPLQHIVLSVGVGMGVGIGSIMSIYLGKGNREMASTTASTGMFFVFLHCVFFAILGIFITKPFLRLFAQEGEQIFQWACDYGYVVICFSFGQLLTMGIEKIFQNAGKMKTCMFFVLFGCILNIILDPIMIFGYLGCPELGVKGAAIATVISQIAPIFLYLIMYYVKDIGLKISFKYIKFDWKLIKKIYLVGLPASLVMAMPSLLTGILNKILVDLDPIYVAIYGLYFKLQTFVNMPAGGVIQGMRPIVSYNYGAKEYKRVKDTIKYSTIFILIITAIGTFITLVLPKEILLLFNADEQLLKFGIPALRIIGLSLVVSTLSIVSSGVFEALGRGKTSLLISLLRQLVIVLPLGFALSRFMGATGIWISFPIAELATLFLSFFLLKKLFKNDLAEKENLNNSSFCENK